MGLFRSKEPASDVLNYFNKPKYPPGQYTTEKFPVLTYGVTPKISAAEWMLKVWGEVEEPKTYSWEEFLKLPQTSLKADFHCVTTWSRYDDTWEGVLFRDLIATVKVKPSAQHVMQHAYGGYTTNLPLEWMLNEDVILAHTMNGKPLERDHGGPVRVFTPRRYAWKGAKWVNGFEFMERDRPGFWEQNGYSNTADPWKEERTW
ncbi:MAG TPA: sulfite oxidase-like oxidoreductase [Bacteroidota bacterium]|nr:sulfite oxidase-like oxidoreductase [Bacteroidota bacterium]